MVLRDVRTALVRIAGGSFGACADCEEEIGVKRLEAVPWAPLCIKCQKADNQRRSRAFHHSPWTLPGAA